MARFAMLNFVGALWVGGCAWSSPPVAVDRGTVSADTVVAQSYQEFWSRPARVIVYGERQHVDHGDLDRVPYDEATGDGGLVGQVVHSVLDLIFPSEC